MQLIVNGSARELPDGTTVSGLLEDMALTGRRIAVERNGEIVPKSLHAHTPLADRDRLEIVVAVGGG
jgi:sulfur carrier protein